MAIVIRKNKAQLEGNCIKPDTQPIELQYGTKCEQNMNDFPAYPYTGYHSNTPSEYLSGRSGSPYSRQVDKDGKLLSCGLDWYAQLLQRHEMLLRVTGEPVVLYRRKWTGERCPCVKPRANQGRGRCPICFGTNFVGGYVRHINLREPDGRIFIRVAPTEEDLELQDAGLFMKFAPNCWTLPAPVVRDRDVIIRFNPDTGEEIWRYEILKVRRTVGFFGKRTRQEFDMERLDRNDLIYKIELVDLLDNQVGQLGQPSIDEYQKQIEAQFGDGYNDKGFSDGYVLGYDRGYNQGLNNEVYCDIFDDNVDGQVDLPYGYGSERTIPASKKHWHEGYQQGYSDGYRDGQLKRKEQGLPIVDPGEERV